MKVGFCWAGSPTHRNNAVRSLPREAIRGLAHVEGIEWVSLAKDAWTPEMGAAGLPDGLAGCSDWLDSAVRVLELDLVVTVDTAIAHLAGGLIGGPPCLVLLAAVPDMRWMLNRTDTPWYRRVRLYRQHIAGDWNPVIAELALDLQALVNAQQENAA